MYMDKISKGVNFCCYKTDKFKTMNLSFSFISPLSEKASLDSLIIHLLSRTCAKYPTILEMNRKLASLYGATITPSVSKSGDSLVLKLTLTAVEDRFALGNESILKEAVDLLCNLVFRPSVTPDGFLENDVEREKRLLIEKIESEKDDKRLYALQRMTEEMCKNETYGLPKYGTEEKIKEATAKDIFERWLRLVVNCPVQITYVGGGDTELIKNTVLSYFEQIQRKAVWPIKTEFIVDAFEQKEIKETQKVKQGKLVIGYRAGMSYDRDNFPAVKLMSMIFGGGTFSKLFTNVREKMSLCYYCAARLNAAKGVITVESGVETEKAESALEAIRNELDEVRKGNLSDETIQNAKLSFRDALKNVYDSTSAIAEWLMGYTLSSVFYTPEELSQLINEVSREEIIVAANMVSEDTVYLLQAEKEEN